VGRPARHGVAWPALLSAFVLGSLGLVGHAAMHNGWLGVLQRCNHIIHLLCAGAWAGSLPVLLLCLSDLSKLSNYRGRGSPAAEGSTAASAAHMEQQGAIVSALRRFSRTGHGVVAGVIVTGVINTTLILGHWPLDWRSPYQRLLDVKIVLVAIMVGIALFNRYVLVRRMRGKVHADGSDARHAALTNLCRGTVAEIILAIAVVTLVSLFATLDFH
jgi:putative copper resistance protein D